jgi:hypothetical protein
MRRFVVLLALVAVACGGQRFQASATQALPLRAGETLGQTFQPPPGTVARVDVSTATFAGTLDPDGELRVVLRDDGRPVARATVPADAILDNAFTPVRFDEPVALAGEASVELGWRGDGAVGLYANVPPTPLPSDYPDEGNDPYPGGHLVRDGTAAAGDLAFRVAGSDGAAGAAGAMLGRWLERLGDAPAFTLAWLALLGGALALAALNLTRGPRTRELGERRPDEQRRQRDEARP